MIADLLFIACLAAVAVGAGLIFMPAGLIVAGLLGAASLYYLRRADLQVPQR